jgi:hypothetical protein
MKFADQDTMAVATSRIRRVPQNEKCQYVAMALRTTKKIRPASAKRTRAAGLERDATVSNTPMK